ncbi:MAG: hypothetical protein PVG83_01965 [Acidimicrobiia bacterium]|jgi:hypothetical protein
MDRWYAFAFVVFATTFIVNVVVVALWPDRSVEWLTSAVVAGVVSVVLTVLARRRSDGR